MSKRAVTHRRLKKYSIGDLRDRIIIHVRSITSPVFNSASFTETYDDGVEVWCYVETLGTYGAGQKLFDDVDVGSQPTHKIVIRYIAGVTKENVLNWRDSMYQIVRVNDPEERLEYMELFCKLLGDDSKEVNT